MIFYLTYNDAPSGIYSSQVIDVVNYLNKEFYLNVKLISFISLRGFFANRRKIKEELPGAIILPMFPGVHRWRLNIYLLNVITWFIKPDAIIGRSVLATQLALLLKKKNRIKKVVYDGRGAIVAEWNEYSVVNDPGLRNEIPLLEKEAVLNSDYRISVSEELIKYWAYEFGYLLKDHVVIPCTLNSIYEQVVISEETIAAAKNLVGMQSSDVIFLYSGSIAGWQSFNLLFNFIEPILKSAETNKMVFLSDGDVNIIKLKDQFPGQVFYRKVKQDDVPQYLLAADYGLLIREESITNKVASPVKFAEYLACGLKVIISKNLGDYSKFVVENKCGYLVDDFRTGAVDKAAIRMIAEDRFTKRSHFNSYKKLMQAIT